MAGEGFTLNDGMLRSYISSLNSADRGQFRTAAKWVRKLTMFTKDRMQRYSRGKTARSTGNLSNSIQSKYRWSLTNMGSEVFVPERIKYQFAAEVGFRQRFTIQGRPLMAFPEENWKKARRASSVIRIGKRGFYIFSKVRRGRYKGRRFTERAYQDLLKEYTLHEETILSELGQGLVFGRFV